MQRRSQAEYDVNDIMKSLIDRINEKYSFWNINPSPELVQYASSCDDYAFQKIDSATIQTSLCEYLDAMASRSRALSEVINRTKEPPLADVFTEATNMLVDSIIRLPELSKRNLQVFSEKNLKLSQGRYRKPDVSIWQDDKLICVVECKTCLGRSRQIWMKDYENRVNEFSQIGLTPSSLILFVATATGWGGFPKDDERTLTSWFTLCPQGTWYGGGKAGEVRLNSLQCFGTVEKLKETIKVIVV